MPRIANIRHRGGTAATWTSTNPILSAREMGIETDTQKFKFGDGTTNWNLLPYSVANASGTSTVNWDAVLNKPMNFVSDNAADFVADNLILPLGTFGYELDTKKFKIGDGSTTWNELRYAGGGGDTALTFLLMGA